MLLSCIGSFGACNSIDPKPWTTGSAVWHLPPLLPTGSSEGDRHSRLWLALGGFGVATFVDTERGYEGVQ